MSLRTIELKVDELDYRAIQAAIAEAQMKTLPNAGYDDANIAGRCIGEICQGWLDLMGKWRMPGEDVADAI